MTLLKLPAGASPPVEVVCHRGASNRAPDNTFAAARQAVAQGADYVELDVNQSADGVHYVFHGPRLEDTTNGVGLFHHHEAVALDALDAGGWFDKAFAGEPIPRLDAMLDYLRGKARVFFDVKRANLPELLALVASCGFTEDCFFWFGRDADAYAFRALTRDLPVKVNVRTAADVHRAKEQLGASIVEAYPRHLSQGLVAACRELNIRLMVNYMGADSLVFAELTRWPIDMINLDHMDLWQAAQAASSRQVATAHSGEKAGVIQVAAGSGVPTAGAPTRRVVLFMLDGCRPDALARAHTPHIDKLTAKGSHTWRARSVMPSISLPCHTALFYSLDPSRHQVLENKWRRPPAPAQSLAEMVRAGGHDVAMFYTWEELRDLSAPGAGTVTFQQRLSQEGLAAVGKAAAHTIAAQKPAFSFVYLEATDAYGHLYGWMSPEYLEAVTYSDGLVGEVIAQLAAGGDDAETVFVVMADHGGHDFGHGTNIDEDMTIPLILAGPGVRRGTEIRHDVSIVDVAPTILALLGIAAPPHWQGKPITDALV